MIARTVNMTVIMATDAKINSEDNKDNKGEAAHPRPRSFLSDKDPFSLPRLLIMANNSSRSS